MVRRGNDALNGERGLLTAIVAQALNDLHTGTQEQRRDARRYFASAEYRSHLTWLGLAPDLLPEGVTPAGAAAGD